MRQFPFTARNYEKNKDLLITPIGQRIAIGQYGTKTEVFEGEDTSPGMNSSDHGAIPLEKREGVTDMQVKGSCGNTQDHLNNGQTIARLQSCGWPEAASLDLTRRPKRAQAAGDLPAGFDPSDDASPLGGAIASRSAGFALPKNKTITISVITGPSRGLMHRLTKPRISVGRTGGGADIEIDEAKASGLHCAVGVKRDVVRLCDLDSTNGTYINGERVHAAQLEHLSEFRVGSSLLLVTILPKREMGME